MKIKVHSERHFKVNQLCWYLYTNLVVITKIDNNKGYIELWSLTNGTGLSARVENEDLLPCNDVITISN